MGSVCSEDKRIGVKTLTADSETFDLKPDHELHTVQLALHALDLRVIAHPSSLNLIAAVSCRPQLTDEH